MRNLSTITAVIIMASASLLSACGFKPLYGSTNTLAGGSTSLEQIIIEDKANGQSSQALKNGLIDRFYHHGYPQNAPYVLKFSLAETSRNIIIQKDNTTTRAQLVLVLDYSLINRETRQIMDHSVIRAVGAYNVLQSQYTTLVTQNSAREAAVNELADKLTMRMAVVLDKE